MRQKRQSKEMTITGYVVANEWDNDDNVVSIGILTDDDEYHVDLKGTGEELLDLLDAEVEVTGWVRRFRDGSKKIKVIGYEVISEDPYGDMGYVCDYEDEGDDADKEWL
jgi:hypothetical protein